MPHDLAVLTVIYNNYTVLEDYLRSLFLQKDKRFHIYIADLSEQKHAISKNKSVSVIPSQNLGYAHGINLCLTKAIHDGYTQFCITNSDTYVDTGFVTTVKTSIKKHPSSIIGGKIFYAPGYEYHSKRYQKQDLGKILWYAGGSVDWDHALTPHRGVDEIDKGQFDRFEKTGFINGCLMCLDNKAVEKVGLWDEDYFLYFEDADYCERAKNKGTPLYYDPYIRIWHKNAQSTGGSGSRLHQNYQEKNRLRFGLKYAPFKTKLHLIKNYLLSRFK